MSSSSLNLKKYRIPLDEIHRVTRNFSSETLIRDGGFGMVHIGQLSVGWQTRTVAIKRLNRDGCQGKDEFYNELKMVASFHHSNIITFMGYCDEADEMIIVYDYAKNGSLDRYLQNPDKMRSLTWSQRLKICLGAAKGLKYLHSGLGEHNRVIHRDVKSANILLNDNLEAKICDFGLSRFGARNEEHSQLLTNAAGTRYYMDPLYAERSRLTKESDIYSLGVVMFEMSSGTLVYHQKCFGDDAKPQYLIDVVRSCYDDAKKAARPDKLIDAILRDQIDMKSFHIFNKIAHECLSLKLEERPPMAKIIRKIEQALNINLNHQESPSTIPTQSQLESILIPLKAIKLATQNFNQVTLIEDNEDFAVHIGKLYGRWQDRIMAILGYGRWQDRTMAITRFKSDGRTPPRDGANDSLRELYSFQHQNVSPLIGYCDEANEFIVVYEHAVNGSVFDHLLDHWNENNRRCHLTWAQRLKICIGVAKGLRYLHLAVGIDDGKSDDSIMCENILLYETMEAKLFFFVTQKQPSPEPRSAMYSFGVIMVEILSGCVAHVLNQFVKPEDQMELLKKYYRNNELDRYIDPTIRDEIDSRCLNVFIETAYRCIKIGNQMGSRNNNRGGGPSGSDVATSGKNLRARFTMDQVIERLEDAADFQGVEI